MKMNKKGVELALNTIIISIIGLIVLFVLVLIFTGVISPVPKLAECGSGIYHDFTCVSESNGPACLKSPCNKVDAGKFCCPKEE
jgi:hypothetical protein